MNYQEFLKNKVIISENFGFEVSELSPKLHRWNEFKTLPIPDVSGSELATCVKCGSFIFTMDARKCVGCGHLR